MLLTSRFPLDWPYPIVNIYFGGGHYSNWDKHWLHKVCLKWLKWYSASTAWEYMIWHHWHDDAIKWKHFPRYWPFVRGIHRSPVNYANPVYVVATICHQVGWLRWGHPGLFHTATSLLIWYKRFCVRDISYRLIWMEFINMFSVYAQSGTHSRFNW